MERSEWNEWNEWSEWSEWNGGSEWSEWSEWNRRISAPPTPKLSKIPVELLPERFRPLSHGGLSEACTPTNTPFSPGSWVRRMEQATGWYPKCS